ncbi:putative glycosyltransferase [Platanthera zijinensis]|uniref:Glycosyltransferase n=1 Tax=Platanthera zijinensis TaxID=2320716 RepID=A0AAP0B4W0_9ASPA
MWIFHRLSNRVSRNMSYVEHMKSSRFCIYPMGYKVNNPRIVESIYYDYIPVIIADNFVLPFEEILNRSSFSVVLSEKDIAELKNVLLSIPLRRYLRMQECVRRVQRHFLWHARPEKYDLFHVILHSIWYSRLKQIKNATLPLFIFCFFFTFFTLCVVLCVCVCVCVFMHVYVCVCV